VESKTGNLSFSQTAMFHFCPFTTFLFLTQKFPEQPATIRRLECGDKICGGSCFLVGISRKLTGRLGREGEIKW